MLPNQSASLGAVRAPRLVVDVLLECVLHDLSLRWNLRMLHPSRSRSRHRVWLRKRRHVRQRWLGALLTCLGLVDCLAIGIAPIGGLHVDLVAGTCPQGSTLLVVTAVPVAVIHRVHRNIIVVNMRAYGGATYGARTGRTKSMALSLSLPTYTHASIP